MRIKNFYANNVTEAMEDIKTTLGDEAIIISTQTMEDNTIMVVAALEEQPDFFVDKQDEVQVFSQYSFDDHNIKDSLNFHSTLDIVRDRIVSQVKILSASQHIFDDKKLLENIFDKIFMYQDILDTSKSKLKTFMGIPGSGKSTAVAKLATKAKIAGLNPLIISTDNVRAGANKQLEAFANVLEVDFKFVKGGKNLFSLIQKSAEKYDLILIDTPGINPYDEEDVEKIREITEALDGDKIMTIDAGKNTHEAVEVSGIFKSIGANLLLPTRMDLTKRVGSLLSIASCCELGFCTASVSSSIAKGLANISNRSLAQLIMS